MTDPHQKLPIKWRAVQRPEWVELSHSLRLLPLIKIEPDLAALAARHSGKATFAISSASSAEQGSFVHWRRRPPARCTRRGEHRLDHDTHARTSHLRMESLCSPNALDLVPILLTKSNLC
jgi:hypothetical protein